MKKYHAHNVENYMERQLWKGIYKLNILPTIRRNSNVKYAEKVLLQKTAFLITIIFTRVRNPTNVNFARLVLPVKEHGICIKEVILEFDVEWKNNICWIFISHMFFWILNLQILNCLPICHCFVLCVWTELASFWLFWFLSENSFVIDKKRIANFLE